MAMSFLWGIQFMAGGFCWGSLWQCSLFFWGGGGSWVNKYHLESEKQLSMHFSMDIMFHIFALRLLTPPMETPDPPNDTPGALKQVVLTAHDIPWSLRAEYHLLVANHPYLVATLCSRRFRLASEKKYRVSRFAQL